MEPIGDPVSIQEFQTPYPSGKFLRTGGVKYRKDSYLYGTLLWVVDMERDSYLLFFSLGGGWVGKFGFGNRLGNHGTYIGNLIRRGNEPSATDTHI